ncbi:hypothetical protein ACLB2K_077382 [Fragaria x ananassa]
MPSPKSRAISAIRLSKPSSIRCKVSESELGELETTTISSLDTHTGPAISRYLNPNQPDNKSHTLEFLPTSQTCEQFHSPQITQNTNATTTNKNPKTKKATNSYLETANLRSGSEAGCKQPSTRILSNEDEIGRFPV